MPRMQTREEATKKYKKLLIFAFKKSLNKLFFIAYKNLFKNLYKSIYKFIAVYYNIFEVKAMNKNMYSLMLMDEVVQAIDKLASENYTNRSSLINQILAEYVSLTTPQQRTKEIFGSLISLMRSAEAFEVQDGTNTSVLSMKSALSYRYRPTIRYAVELYEKSGQSFGELRVTFRSQSSNLLMELTHFLNMFIRLERHYIHPYFAKGSIDYRLEEGRFRRSFAWPKNENLHTPEHLGTLIGNYIHMFDDMLKQYMGEKLTSFRELEDLYLTYLESGMSAI